MVCTAPQAPADNRCQILSDIDISECLVDPVSWKIVNSNALRAIEPALIGIGDLSVGSNLELVRHDRGMSSSDSASGWGIRPGDMCIPEQFR